MRVQDGSWKVTIPTGGPAGTTHFFSDRVEGGALLCLATPSCIIFSTSWSSSRGKGTWCTRRWDPSEGRGNFWNAMWGFGFSYSTCEEDTQLYVQWIYSKTCAEHAKMKKYALYSRTQIQQWKYSWRYSHDVLHFCIADQRMTWCASADWQGWPLLP